MIILKNDEIFNHSDLDKALRVTDSRSHYDRTADKYILDETNHTLDTTDWSDECSFSGEEIELVHTPFRRLQYALACLHNDDAILKVINEEFPEITDMCTSSIRYTTKPYLQYWMDKYNFTLKDFIFNNKYIVVSDNSWSHQLIKMVDLGLLDWDNIEVYSEDAE